MIPAFCPLIRTLAGKSSRMTTARPQRYPVRFGRPIPVQLGTNRLGAIQLDNRVRIRLLLRTFHVHANGRR
jgi:hypothetical protein